MENQEAKRKQAAVTVPGPPPVLSPVSETAAFNNHESSMLSPSCFRGGNEHRDPHSSALELGGEMSLAKLGKILKVKLR